MGLGIEARLFTIRRLVREDRLDQGFITYGELAQAFFVIHTIPDEFWRTSRQKLHPPARRLPERRLKRSPLRDVAGMLRSFSCGRAGARLLRGVDVPEE